MVEPQTLDCVRIDKWLWSVRICKTRVMATDLCKRQRVTVDGMLIKPSKDVRVGQLVRVKKDGVHWEYKVLKCIDKRVGAKIADTCKEDLTSEEEKKKLIASKTGWRPLRDKGAGRPTKKERRDLEGFLDPEL